MPPAYYHCGSLRRFAAGVKKKNLLHETLFYNSLWFRYLEPSLGILPETSFLRRRSKAGVAMQALTAGWPD
jgi:hypothetical protein